MLIRIIKEDFKETYLCWDYCWIDHRHNSSITLSIHQFNKRTARRTNSGKSLRRADRTVLKDFLRNYTLIFQDLYEPSQ